MSFDISFEYGGQEGKESTYLHCVRWIVIGVTLVSVVQQPHVPVVEDFVICASEELLEVGSRLDQFGQPNHRRQIRSASLQELASQLHCTSICYFCTLYITLGVS